MRVFAFLFALVLSTLPAKAALYEPVGSSGTPTMGTCGTSPSVSGTDTAGVITVGSGAVTSCALNFSATLPSIPICMIAPSLATVTAGVSVTTSALTITTSLTIGGGKIWYFCPLN